MKMDKWLGIISRVDYVVAAGTVGYGVWTSSVWWIVMGLLGLVVAWWGPARRASKWIEGYMVKRGVKGDDSAELAHKEALYAGVGVSEAVEAKWGVMGVVAYGEVRLVNSKHNVLLKGARNRWDLSEDVKWA